MHKLCLGFMQRSKRPTLPSTPSVQRRLELHGFNSHVTYGRHHSLATLMTWRRREARRNRIALLSHSGNGGDQEQLGQRFVHYYCQGRGHSSRSGRRLGLPCIVEKSRKEVVFGFRLVTRFSYLAALPAPQDLLEAGVKVFFFFFPSYLAASSNISGCSLLGFPDFLPVLSEHMTDPSVARRVPE